MTDTSRPESKRSGEIGILLGRRKWEQLVSNQHDNGTNYLMRAVSTLGITPLWFTIPQEKLEHGLVLAARREGHWRIGHFPIPKVVYDRALFRKKDRPEAGELRKALASQGVRFVNSRSAFSKWTTHLVLAENTSLVAHLPKTISFKQTADLKHMLSIFPKVCVKSFWGSRGQEVLFIENARKGWEVLYPNGGTKRFSQVESLTDAIRQFMGNKECVIQQRIKLASWRGQQLDLRILLQKVSLDAWDCTALCLRLALPGYGATSTSQGGRVVQAVPVFSEIWPYRYKKIIDQAKMLAFRAAQTLEQKYGPLGELGIDVGIDVDGFAWLFEVNGKPGKTTVRRLKQQEKTLLAYQRPLLYAQMLLEGK